MRTVYALIVVESAGGPPWEYETTFRLFERPEDAETLAEKCREYDKTEPPYGKDFRPWLGDHPALHGESYVVRPMEVH